MCFGCFRVGKAFQSNSRSWRHLKPNCMRLTQPQDHLEHEDCRVRMHVQAPVLKPSSPTFDRVPKHSTRG